VAGDEQKSYYDNTPFESLNFEYNIRGWLKGINKNYANTAAGINLLVSTLMLRWETALIIQQHMMPMVILRACSSGG
jgi:hypothetical protein